MIKRKAILVDSACNYDSLYKRHLCIDENNYNEIWTLAKKKIKRFTYIVQRTLTQNGLYWDCYGQEVINGKSKNVSAIKFFDIDNTRIYCKEMSDNRGNFYIICSILLMSKKVQKNNKPIIEIIEKISSYEYEIVR